MLTSSHIFIPTGAPGAPYGLPGDPSAGSLSGHPGQNGAPAAAKELTLVYNDELESMVRLHERRARNTSARAAYSLTACSFSMPKEEVVQLVAVLMYRPGPV